MVDCTGPALCNPPAGLRGEYYTVGYKNGCYEGCVRKNECIVPACPQTPPANGASCGPVDYPCFYQDCAGKGRTLATCAGGAWAVQTTACSSVDCEGLTCSAGQVCVRTNLSTVVYSINPSCVDNRCDEDPVFPQCLAGLSRTCSSPCEGAGGCAGGSPWGA